eukprot:TRINITY_DN7923_c0_g1_i1.p1 TRINITY_DN7923_c0_g1~~TRINITY_DN7923_c0_g1_i1.p1  ORF type:complete len:511 (-),score=108.75 TRINITY_DN7923_c0_g1_i1:1606-3138(-)
MQTNTDFQTRDMGLCGQSKPIPPMARAPPSEPDANTHNVQLDHSLLQKYKEAQQHHVFQFWDDLSEAEKKSLLESASRLDLNYLKKIYERAMKYESSINDIMSELSPLEKVTKKSASSSQDIERWEALGFKAISEGRVGALVLAGGQGTRLGSPHPKGMFDIGLPSNKSLFQIQAERITKLQNLARQKFPDGKNVIPWYIMTSTATDKETVAFFREHNFFGLQESNVVFFNQSDLPALTLDGKIIMESKAQMANAPDGNGGLYIALERSGSLQDMISRGVEHIHQYCVDNILVRVADPIFIGFCEESKSDCACKVVSKRSHSEPVGVVCLRDGKYGVVEYSEIDKETAKKTNELGSLVFNAAHICINYFSVDFLKKAAHLAENVMWHHVARKKIPFVNASGLIEKPQANNGIKLEQFIFDMFPHAENLVAFEVPREEDFSPLKNATGEDSPETSRQLLSDLHKRYIVAAGGSFGGDVTALCEISPLLSYGGEGLEKIASGQTIQLPCHLD